MTFDFFSIKRIVVNKVCIDYLVHDVNENGNLGILMKI